MKRTAIDHPKILRLAKLLKVQHCHAVGIMECLWQFTAKHATRGDIGKWTNAEIADDIGWPSEDADRLVKALISCRLVDENEPHRLVVHDWPDHCEDSVHMMLSRKIEHFADGARPSMSRLPKLERDSLDAEYKRLAKPARTRTKTHKNAQDCTALALPEPKPCLSQALPEPSQGQATKTHSPPAETAPGSEARQRQWEHFVELYPLTSNGRHLGIEEARGQFSVLVPGDIPKIFQAVKHYSASDFRRDGKIMNISRFVTKDWFDWIAPPRAGPGPMPKPAAAIPKDWHKEPAK